MHVYLQKSSLSLAVGLSLLLTACGGGGGSTETVATPSSTTPTTPNNNTATTTPTTPNTNTSTNPVVVTPTPTITPAQRINTAVASGDASGLLANKTTDEKALLEQIISELSAQQTRMQNTVTSILQENGKTLNLAFSGVADSITLRVTNPFVSRNILISNTGVPLSTLSEVNGARLLGYGAKVLEGVNNADYRYKEHTPILNRSLNWLITGNANTKPTSLTIAYQGYDKNTLLNYFKSQYNITPTFVQCQFYDPANTCWQDADVLVMGNYVPNATDLQNSAAVFAKYQQAKKPILYIGSNWYSGDANRNRFLSYYGIDGSGYYGNYWVNPNIFNSDSTNNSLNQIFAQTETLKPLLTTLEAISQNRTVSQSELTQMRDAIRALRGFYYQQNQAGQSVFFRNDTQTLQKMTLLADMWRQDTVYGGFTRDDVSTAQRYLKTLIADNWIDFKRPASIAPRQGAGDYMPATANTLPVSSDWEEISITLNQGSGYTAIGRASIPAKGVQIEILDAGSANLSLQTGYIRATQDRDTQDGKATTYARPDKATSPSVSLKNGVTDFNSPYGGALFLRFDGATAGQVIKLRIKGVAKYAHFDFTRTMSNQEINEAITALKDNKFGWNTFKFVGSEIQQTNAYALRAIGNQDPKVYVNNLKTVIFDSNHIANGYNNMPLDSSTAQYCNTLGWDCNSDTHRAPNMQHMIGWIAQCGYLCSGQPIDAYTGVDLGWGWVHELGHNTVQRVLSMQFTGTTTKAGMGCQVECDNNILAGLSMLRKNELLKENTNGHNFAHWTLYNQAKASRATNLTGENLRVDMENRLWAGDGYTNANAKQAMTMQLALFYTKHKQGKAVPDSQGVFEFIRLLNIANRLTDKVDLKTATAQEKAKYGLGAYSEKSYNTPELVYMLSSKIIGKDMKDVFELYGLPVSDTAHRSVAMLNLPTAPLDFYAQPQNRANFLAEGQWLTIPATGQLADYPY